MSLQVVDDKRWEALTLEPVKQLCLSWHAMLMLVGLVDAQGVIPGDANVVGLRFEEAAQQVRILVKSSAFPGADGQPPHLAINVTRDRCEQLAKALRLITLGEM